MSAIAGRLAVQIGAWCLQKQNGGSGVLLCGLEGIAPGRIVILGAGNVGANALQVAHGIGAEVTVFARSEKPRLKAQYPRATFRTGPPAVEDADLVIAGVLSPGRPTSHSEPIYIEEGVVHYCVPNLPAACARTASLALERAVLPFVSILLRNQSNSDLATGVQVKAGKVTHEHLARDTGRAYFAL